MLMEGIHIPLTAPFYRDGANYLRKLEHNVRRYSLTPASALVAFSPGLEAEGFTDAEIAASLQTIAEAAAAEKVLMAGLPRTSVAAALAIAEQAGGAGFDAVLVAPPLDVAALSALERLTWFRAVADASPLPVMLYSSDQGVGATLSVLEAAELALHPNVLGMYDAALSPHRFSSLSEATSAVRREVTVTQVFAPVTQRMLRPEPVASELVSIHGIGATAVAAAAPTRAIKTRTKAVGFQMIAAGRVAGAVDLLRAGTPGLMPALAAAAPQGCHEVYAAFKDGDALLAEEKAARLASADDVMSTLGIAGVKHACDLNGYFGGKPRLPRLPLTAANQEQIEHALGSVRN